MTEEEMALVNEQANGEFNKAFRKSDTYEKDLPEDKIKSFSTILGKFFENEAEDYQKEASSKTPDYDGLLKKAGDKKMDFSLKNRIFEHDRDADRRYNYAVMRISNAQHDGTLYPQSSPQMEKWQFMNNDTETHESNLRVIEFLKEQVKKAKPEDKEHLQASIDLGVPPMGTMFEVWLPAVVVNQIHTFATIWQEAVKKQSVNMTAEEKQKWYEEDGQRMEADVINFLMKNYVAARDEVEKDAMAMKAFFRSQEDHKDDTTRTKADVFKELWEVFSAEVEDAPPLDEELMEELKDMPAIVDGEFMHSWGIADKLYKSEAIDAFGGKYLLGVFETISEARQAFEDWNAEYEKSRAVMKEELEQWGKQEEARLAADPEPVDRIKKVLEAARR